MLRNALNRAYPIWLLAALSVSIDLWMFRAFHLGTDTHTFFDCFYQTYNNLFFHGELSGWAPYLGYGQPLAVYYLFQINPVDFLPMLAGWIFGVREVLILFKASIMLAHLIALFGMYLLADLLFKSRLVVLAVCAASLSLLHPLYLDYVHVVHFCSFCPLILYFTTAFLRDRRPVMLWLAGICFSFSSHYALIYWGLAMAVFAAVMVSVDWRGYWRSLFERSLANGLVFGLFILSLGAYAYLALTCLEGVTFARPGRDAESGKTLLPIFLGVKCKSGHEIGIFLRSLALGDGFFYAGLLPLFCFLWALLRVRSRLFAALVCSMAVLMWFALYGTFSLLMYYLPLVAKARYLYLGHYYVKLLLVAAMGLALESWWTEKRPLRTLLFCGLLTWFGTDFFLMYSSVPPTPEKILAYIGGHRRVFLTIAVYLALAAAAVLVAALRTRMEKGGWGGFAGALRVPLLAALVAGTAFDVSAYLYKARQGHKPMDYKDATLVHRLSWQAQRGGKFSQWRQYHALKDAWYFTAYDFAQYDPIFTKRQIMTYASGVYSMAGLRDKKDFQWHRVMGAGAPKLRLVTKALYAQNEAEAAFLIRESKDLYNTAVIQPVVGSPPLPEPAAGEAGKIVVTEFTANSLEARVVVNAGPGAWLLYADGFHPGWHANVNGATAPISRAYVGLKAIWLPQGGNEVFFRFRTAFMNVTTARALFSALFCLAILLWMLRLALPFRAAESTRAPDSN